MLPEPEGALPAPSRRRFPPAEVARDLWRQRRFVAGGALRELRWRYAGTTMGLVWHLAVPLVQVAIYVVVFGSLVGARGASGSVPGYTLFLCAGLLPWLALSDGLGRGSASLLANESYLKRLAVPEVVFVAQSVATSGLTLVFYAAVLVVMALLTGLPARWSWLLLAPVLALFLGFCFGLALVLAVLTVFFRDVGQVVGVALQMWFWLTPIVYDPLALGPRLGRLLAWNPPTAYIESVRRLLTEGTPPGASAWVWMAGLALGACALGAFVLEGLRSDLRDAL